MENKKLFRSNKDKRIAGICGGLGKLFNIDSNIFRILFIFAAFLSGLGIIAYLILLFIIPEENSLESKNSESGESKVEYTPYTDVNDNSFQNLSEDDEQSKKKKETPTIAIIGGVLFIGLGVLLLLRHFLPDVIHQLFFPCLLIFCGLLLLIFCKPNKKQQN